MRSGYRLILLGLMIAAMILATGAESKCPVGGCGGGRDYWMDSAEEFLNSDLPLSGVSETQNSPSIAAQGASAATNVSGSGLTTPEAVFKEPDSRSSSYPRGGYLKPLTAFSSTDTVIDVSDHRSAGESRIKGAISIPYKSFLKDNGTLMPVDRMAAAVENAGVAGGERITVYSDEFGSGEAAFVLWVLAYLGQTNVKALDGGLRDWTAASLPLETKYAVRPSASFEARPMAELLSDYDYVKSGIPQTVDARTFQDFGKKRILGASFVGRDSILEDGRLKSAAELNDSFARLNRSRPVVVYSSDLQNASLVWYALWLMGFDSRIYSWQDWQEHEGASGATAASGTVLLAPLQL